MAHTVRNAPTGKKTVYIEHGVWRDVKMNCIFVNVDGCSPWAVQPGTKQYIAYEAILRQQGRWNVLARP
jgi:hypothetical protein